MARIESPENPQEMLSLNDWSGKYIIDQQDPGSTWFVTYVHNQTGELDLRLESETFIEGQKTIVKEDLKHWKMVNKKAA